MTSMEIAFGATKVFTVAVAKVTKKTKKDQSVAPGGVNFKAPTLSMSVMDITPESRRQMSESLARYKGEISEFMHKAWTAIRNCLGMTAEEKLIFGDQIPDLTAQMEEALESENPAVKAITLIAYANAQLATCPENWPSLVRAASDLQNRGFWGEVKIDHKDLARFDVRIDMKVYRTSAKLAEVYTAEVDAVVKAGRHVASALYRAQQEAKKTMQSVAGEDPITENIALDIFNGKLAEKMTGRVILKTPFEKFERGGFRSAGVILVEFFQDHVEILDGTGGCLKHATDLKAVGGEKITLVELRSEKPRFSGANSIQRLRWMSHQILRSAFKALQARASTRA